MLPILKYLKQNHNLQQCASFHVQVCNEMGIFNVIKIQKLLCHIFQILKSSLVEHLQNVREVLGSNPECFYFVFTEKTREFRCKKTG